MNFYEYVDWLAKSGQIDGNIADVLISKFNTNVANPLDGFRKSVTGLLNEMWARRGEQFNGCGPAEYADRFDDCLTEYEELAKKGIKEVSK